MMSYTKTFHICWTGKGALCVASSVYCEPWLVWIQECEELITETQSNLIPSSLRPCSLNTLRPCTAEGSYLFFLSCWATLHTPRTRGSHAFQQWCIMDHRRRRERADCCERGKTPPQCSFTLRQLSSTSSFCFASLWDWTEHRGWGSGSGSCPLTCSLCTVYTQRPMFMFMVGLLWLINWFFIIFGTDYSCQGLTTGTCPWLLLCGCPEQLGRVKCSRLISQ